MNNKRQNHFSSLQKICAILGEIDQNIEEWINHFINQIENENQGSDQKRKKL